MQKYNHSDIEAKWREVWEKDNPAKAEDNSTKPKKYILAEFPYPSGEGLHIGHLMRYTMPDVYARKLRMSGYNVLFPMGWDAFGLPAENYAVKTGVHPEVTTKKAIATFTNQLKSVGYGFDWEREIATTDPKYYKWTQWIFLKFWEQGLAELKEEPVWWCEDLKTVLANEEVIKNEKGELISERGEKPVERRMLKQWVLKMPAYADKLISGLENVDFPESIKSAQINWIGKSTGAEIDFKFVDSNSNQIGQVTVFTTAHDTIFGATFLVLAPEHNAVKQFQNQITNWEEVSAYIEKTAQKSDLDRQADKQKTGVELVGIKAVNPLNGQQIPVFIADYVLASYGAGAIMAVPGHDDRDLAFAQAYDLPVVYVTQQQEFISYSEVIKADLDAYTMANSGEFDGMTFRQGREAIMNKLDSTGAGTQKVEYKLRDWLFSRQRYWGEPIPLLHKQDGTIEPVVDTNDVEGVKTKLPLLLPEVPDYTPSSDAASPLAKNADWVNTVDSEGNPAMRETNTMPNWAGSCWYYLRYIDPHNDEAFADPDKLQYWLPVDKYFGGSEHTTMHLLYSRFWHIFLYDQGLVPTAEPYAWRMNGGLLMGTDGQKMSKSKGNVLVPDEKVKTYGADALRLYINFMSPYDQNAIWQEGGLKACRRLVEDMWDLSYKVSDQPASDEVLVAYNKMVQKVTVMIDELRTNTAVSEFMILVNLLKTQQSVNTQVWEGLVLTMAPFTPFLSEELWSRLGHSGSVHLQAWPQYDADKLTEDTVSIAVQVNGKLRGTIVISKDASEQEVISAATNDAKVQNFIDGREIKKSIYVAGRVVNIVI